jgi:hypothetical protein
MAAVGKVMAAVVCCTFCLWTAAAELSHDPPAARLGIGPAGGAGRDAAPSAAPRTVGADFIDARAAPTSQSSGSAAPAGTRTIAAGDTWPDIAGPSGVPAAANGLSEQSSPRVGRVLTIPKPGTPAAGTPAAGHGPARPVRTAPSHPATVAGRIASAPPAAPEVRHLALRWPSGGIVTSRFGWRTHPIFGGREFHTGMDIATRYGSPVVAARAGIVRFVGWKSGYGRLIVIEHGGGLETTYSHLSATLVSPGDAVAQGQLIGRIGSSGWSTGPHLFFEVRRNGVPVDPAPYLP